MSSSLRRDLLGGALAGLVGGLVFAWAVQAQGMMVNVAGLVGSSSAGIGIVLHLALSVLIGASFGAIFRHQPDSYATTISSSLLYSLLWWIVGPLTLMRFIVGQGLTWSVVEASAAFPSLVGHLLYGGVTGLSFYLIVALYLSKRPEFMGADEAPQRPSRRIVILGGGFGGVATAEKLEQTFPRDLQLEITLVSQSNFLLFTPMLAEVASSGLEAQHISAPVRAALPRSRFLKGEIVDIDTGAQVIRVRAGRSMPVETIPYDHLVLALGSSPNFYNLPGLEVNSFALKTLQDATRLRDHTITMLEQADVEPDEAERRRLLTFAVAGGGFAGTEMIAELSDLVYSVLRYYPYIRKDELRFVLVHSGDHILPELSLELGAYALNKLQSRGIEFKLNARVAGATPEAVLLNDGSQIPSRTKVWTAGNQPSPLLKTLPFEHNRSGQLITDETLRVKGSTNVWAVGDCAQIPDAFNPGKFCPPTAQHALREGKVAAENILAAIRGNPLKPFRFQTLGLLVALGHRTAAAEVRGYRFSGLVAWFMWRSIYLSKLPGLEKKVRVAFDWTLDLFFPRDIVLTMNAVPPPIGNDSQAVSSPVEISISVEPAKSNTGGEKSASPQIAVSKDGVA
ncbi:MAG: NAD(P)/FAD-dependent oxidoreductase [Chloroflexi bacterium]|nr:NAD(P)/FAD-dependent oxidoreductase [Chloroflexota bacterium]